MSATAAPSSGTEGKTKAPVQLSFVTKTSLTRVSEGITETYMRCVCVCVSVSHYIDKPLTVWIPSFFSLYVGAACMREIEREKRT